MTRKLSLLAAFFIFSISIVAQDGSIRGRITSQINGQPLHGVSIQLATLNRTAETDDNGDFSFSNIPAGRYTLITHIEGFSDQTRAVAVIAGETLTADFQMSILSLREEVTVTASGEPESIFESFQSVNSIGSGRILEQAGTGIGEVLERESGVGKRSFGPGSSRPVIRGFDGDRVLVLQDGARSGSLGSQSADHGEPIDTLNLERVEIIKGPATLLYGSNAIGGVVNAVTSDEDEAHPGARGYFSTLGASNNKQAGIAGGVEYGFNQMLLNFSAHKIRDGEFETPLGAIPNSSSRSHGGKGSFGVFGKKVFAVGSIALDRRRYGVPYAPLFEGGDLLTNADGEPCENIGEEGSSECLFDIDLIQDRFLRQLPDITEEEIDIKMRQNNFRLRGGFRDVEGPISQGNFFIDYTRYKHDEIETVENIDDIATTFFNNTFSYRGVLKQAKYKALTGQFGFEGYRRNYLTLGAEALIDGKVKQDNFSFFGLQELSFNRVALQFGGRVETNRIRPENIFLEDRNFTGVSTAVAARFRLWEGASFIANFTSAYRSPALEELYNEGPHVGTVTFEIGDQGLRRERSNGVEFSLRQRINRLRLNGSFFYYKIDNFIFLEQQDEDDDGNIDVADNLPIGAFVQKKARFAGADVTLEADLKDWLGLNFTADIVKAELASSNIPLPRITPARARIGVDLRYAGLSVRPEAVFTDAKAADDIFTLETPTAGYALFNVNASYTIASQHLAHTFSVSTQNIGDRLYRNALSFIKDLAPEQGRTFRASYTLRFY